MKKVKLVKTFVEVFDDVMRNKKEYKDLVVPYFERIFKTKFSGFEKSDVGFYLKNDSYELAIENIGHDIKVVIAYFDESLDRPFIFNKSNQEFNHRNVLKIKKYLYESI